ncbi:MAG: PEGA domain-containing protein [Humidesulfovibrio sp.]|nr:PEGA domain-containing protein [Humidesulfovibrio sp.]
MRRRSPLLLCLAAAALSGCVATQKVPVSTDPLGALVYLDGKQVCPATPCSVEIPKDQDHLLTIVKDGYRQKDIPVRRVFDSAAVLRESVRQGVRAAKGGSDLGGAFSSAASSADKQEKDGRAYVLAPDMVSPRLVPVGEPLPEEHHVDKRQEGTDDPAVNLGLEIFRMLDGGTQDNGSDN